MGFEELFDLAKEDGCLHGLYQHLVGAHVLPFVIVDREGRKQRDGGVVGSVAGGLYDLAAGSVGLHAHVGDDHLVLAQFDLGFALARRGGGIDIEAADLEDGFHGEQDGDFIVNQ